MAKEILIPDGTFDFSGGVNSDLVTTVRSELVPHGLPRNQLAWLSNGTVRGGTISPRSGQNKLLDLVTSGLWQGGYIYDPFLEGLPYLVCSISGHIYKALLVAPFTVTDLSVQFGIFNPATPDQAFFEEAEGILCIQAGDFFTNPPGTKPLFYRSATLGAPEILRRSNGLTGSVTYPNINEIPAATSMCYYQDRLWYAQGRTYTAGDIVGNQTSGTAPYGFRDSVFKVTENPLAVGGDGFTVPTQAGNIRALKYVGQIDTTLGQGPLYIFTRRQIYSLQVPVTRTAWIAANNNNMPLQTVAQINNGSAGERNIFAENGDLYYQSFTPDIRSLVAASRFFGQPGNIGISKNVNRALQFVDRSIMRFNSSISYANRGLNGTLPKQTPSGVVTQGLLPLNFDEISTLEEKLPPVWEGMWEGLDALQHFTGDFGGLPRAFSVVVSRKDASIDVWEIVDSATRDNNDDRIDWYAEFPAFTWSTTGNELDLKRLRSGELWIDRVKGTVLIDVFWRPDADPCWHNWFSTSFCAARNCAEDVNNPVCYPLSPNYRDGYAFPIIFPEPPDPAACAIRPRRPSNIGIQHQVKVQAKGYFRIRGLMLYSDIMEREQYDGLECD